jgi:hypothetical protein
MGFRNSTDDPEEVFTIRLLSFSSHGAFNISRSIGFNLDVYKFSTLEITAKNVRVWVITKGDRGAVATSTKLPRDKKLRRIPPCTLFLRLFNRPRFFNNRHLGSYGAKVIKARGIVDSVA